MAFSFPYSPVYEVSSWEKTMNSRWQYWLQKEWADKNTQNSQNHNHGLKSSEKPVYTIIMPPPNVTGSLHLGHALSSYLQSLLIRWHRMKGFDVLWVPGLDHASIAVQMMVEKQLAAQGIKRQELDRETFLQHAWTWKEKHGHGIVNQLKAMGFVAQWDALCFTLDAPMNHGVNTAFKRLYDAGLIYRAQRLVHWDVNLETAVSDLEVVNKTEPGHLWTIEYKGQGDISIAVATSRPETLFGDQGIAVHPDDPRYGGLIGQSVQIPLTDRWISIFADHRVQMDKGTGAVKITPAHDPLDYAIGKDHGLSMVTILTTKGAMESCPEVPPCYWGLDRFTARQKVLDDLKIQCHLKGEESIVHSVPYSDRSNVVIEPRLTHQWYLDVEKMAALSLEKVQQDDTTFFPASWKNTYDHWLTNIQPWCLSRQLWWGHRLPVWYGPDHQVIVALNEEEAHEKAKEIYGKSITLHQDEDVLDTWFSSALWPLTTLGWPGDDGALHHGETGYIAGGKWQNKRYPTDVLVTGFDILFFWVARMMMMALGMEEDVPFRHVVIHPLIQDEKGQKMSKTKNNVIDPMDVVEACGVDTMGFALMSALTDKMHCPFGQKNLQEAHQFMTKFWNLFRFFTSRDAWGPQVNKDFLRQNTDETLEDLAKCQPPFSHPLNHWIVGEFHRVSQELDNLLASYSFHEALLVLKSFTWNVCCDWYVELGKIFFSEEMRHMFTWCGGQLLRLWHPFIPFITEKLWQEVWHEEECPLSSSETSGNNLNTLWQAQWPSKEIYKDFSQEMSHGIFWLQQLISWTRSLRLEFSLGHKIPLRVHITEASSELENVLSLCQESLEINGFLTFVFSPPSELKGGVAMVLEGVSLFVPLGHLLDIPKERQRLAKEKEKILQELKKTEEKLKNTEFLSKAPLAIREGLEERFSQQKKTLDVVENFEKNLNINNK